MTPVGAWARAFAVTLIVELAVAIPLLKSCGASLMRRTTAVGLAQLASHPLFWFVLPELGLRGFALLCVGEAWAVALELGVYLLAFPNIGRLRALGVSALANGASLGVGTVLRASGGFV